MMPKTTIKLSQKRLQKQLLYNKSAVIKFASTAVQKKRPKVTQGHLKDTVDGCFFDDEENIDVLCDGLWKDIVNRLFQRRAVEMIVGDNYRAALQHSHSLLLHYQLAYIVHIHVVRGNLDENP